MKKQKKSVVIVESPAKAKTINKFLGSGYTVKACFGHVRDLPPRKFGIDVEKDFEADYRIIKGRQKVLSELKKAVKSAELVYLAPDPDREGEAIAWHLQQALELSDEKAFRITFNEITEKAVNAALKHPGKIVMDRVNAQQARRFLDRIVGYRLSPLLWKKVARGLSAGRVQSVAVMLIVDREEEINKFKAEEYWRVSARFNVHRDVQPIPAQQTHTDTREIHHGPEQPLVEPGSFAAELRKVDGKEWECVKGEEAKPLVEEISKGPFRIVAVTKKDRREEPPPPLITSLLQQQASIRLRFSTKKTMMIAQQLYEGVELGAEGPVGLITYMRTDSFRVADEANAELRKLIVERYGERYLNPEIRKFAAKKGAQEAHEAIRPSDPSRSPEKLKQYLTEDQFKLYRLIWKRFVATQMTPALYHLTEAEVQAGRATLVAKGKELGFDGFTKIAGHALKKDDQLLPALTKGQEVFLREMNPSQHFTQPPPRFSEATLVKALEKHGIGRPSTYAPIISTVQDRGYVRNEQRKLFPTELGILVTEKLKKHFADIMNTTFTSQMEEKLDLIEDAKADWVGTLREYYGAFEKDLALAQETMESVKSLAPESGELCEKCSRPMLIRWNKSGKFLGCSGFTDKDNQCKNTKSLTPIETTSEVCESCSKPMVIRSGRRGKFLACTGYPDCRNTRNIDRTGRPAFAPIKTEEKCEKCESMMLIRLGRRGPFLACSAFPKCRSTRPVPEELKRLVPPPPKKDEPAAVAPPDEATA